MSTLRIDILSLKQREKQFKTRREQVRKDDSRGEHSSLPPFSLLSACSYDVYMYTWKNEKSIFRINVRFCKFTFSSDERGMLSVDFVGNSDTCLIIHWRFYTAFIQQVSSANYSRNSLCSSFFYTKYFTSTWSYLFYTCYDDPNTIMLSSKPIIPREILKLCFWSTIYPWKSRQHCTKHSLYIFFTFENRNWPLEDNSFYG